eukprot:scaffold1992_cov113-Cylindrotheca_fusiformis.AAC.6
MAGYDCHIGINPVEMFFFLDIGRRIILMMLWQTFHSHVTPKNGLRKRGYIFCGHNTIKYIL